ncbi:hypothetical protein GX411_08290 [Candidatus Fermentibacteria bacterium]|nr:hypothetical protein [Candidatus Fermentibacteria bacterium]
MGMFALLAAAASAAALGYEEGMPNLVSPYLLEPGISEITIQHRFYGEAFDDAIDDFLGADLGANISIGLRSFVAPGIELDLSHTRAAGEYSAGAGFNSSVSGSPVSFHVSAHWFTLEANQEERESGFCGIASVEAGRLGDLVAVTANAAYDSRAERLGLGFGLDAVVTENISLQGEYWPARDGGDDFPADSMDAWCFGLRASTWGHQFGLLFGNSWLIGPRSMAAGADDDEIRMGLTIRRRLAL